MSGPISPGRFVWYDLMTPDTEGAIEFYSKVIGWTVTDWDGSGQPDAEPYQMWNTGEKPVGGLATLPADAIERGAPPHWLAYVTVPDTADVVDKTTKAGGELLVPPTTMPGVGTFAVLKDPQGAVFAPFTPEKEDPNSGGPAEVGGFSWHELATNSHEEAFAFYADIFGWKKTDSMDMGEAGIYQMYGRGDEPGFPYGGMFNKPTEVPWPPHWLYYIRVAELDAALEAVKENGGKILNGPMDVPGGDRIAQCMDPQGAAFALHSTA
jgi:predicted enzyme related to lactoylglutathione lyase